MRIFSLIAAASVILSGCGMFPGEPGKDGAPGVTGPRGEAGPPGPQAACSTHSGERIKARFIVTDDGAQTPVGWLDADTGIPCSFVTADDGFPRCLPIVPKSDLIRVFYSDSSCSFDAVAVGVEEQDVLPCAPLGVYVEDVRHETCSEATVVYAVGPAFAGPNPPFYSDGKACIANLGKKYDFFKVSSVAPTEFVGAKETIK